MLHTRVLLFETLEIVCIARYNKLVGQITKLIAQLRGYDASDSYRIEMTKKLLQKLYDMGLITTKASLASCDKVNVSAFCRLLVTDG